MMMKTSVSIDRMQVYARHGVMPREQKTGNLFEVSVTLDYDFSVAAESDDIDKAINYAEIAGVVTTVMAEPCKLIETVVMKLRNVLCSRWPEITGGRIVVTKVHPPIAPPTPKASVSVEWQAD